MSARVAALPMYDLDRDAVQAWWDALAGAFRDEGLTEVPSSLAWPDDLEAHWRHPRLLLGQTCGHPLATRLRAAVQVVGAMRYGAPGCQGIGYVSRLVVRRSDGGRALADFEGRTAAVNDLGSYSGHVALRRAVQAAGGSSPFFGATLLTGAHRASLQAVRSGAADIAAVDCVTVALVARHAPGLLDGLAILGSTPLAPGLPLITSGRTPAGELAALQRGLARAVADPALAAVRGALFIEGFEPVPAARWVAAVGSPGSAGR